MRFDLTQEITWDDKPIMMQNGDEESRPITLRDIVRESLIFVKQACPLCRSPAEEPNDPEAMERYHLAVQMKDAETIELLSKQITMIQERIAKRYATHLPLRCIAQEMLEHPLPESEVTDEEKG